MAIEVHFELHHAATINVGRLSSAFTRLGWEHFAKAQYRFPRANRQKQVLTVSDLLNNVVPALMVLRAFLRAHPDITLNAFEITMIPPIELDPGQKQPVVLPAVKVLCPGHKEFGAAQLKAMLDGFVWPYND